MAATYTSQHLLELIKLTDLLTSDEKQKLISFMPKISPEERDMLVTQLMEYEARKKEILADAEKRRQQIEEDYYKQMHALREEQEQMIRKEIKRREAQEKAQANTEADTLLNAA